MTVNLLYPNDLKREIENFGITTQEVKSTFDNPDDVEYLKNDKGEIKVHLFLKAFTKSKQSYKIITLGSWLSQGNYQFIRIFKVYDDLNPSNSNWLPSEFLFELANRFGYTITIDGISQKFFFMQDISIKPETAQSILIRNNIDIADLTTEPELINLFHTSISGFIAAICPKDDAYIAKCMLIFALNPIAYLDYLKKNQHN